MTNRQPLELPDDAFQSVTRFRRAAALKERYGLEHGGYVAACYRRNGMVGVTERTMDRFAETLQYARERTDAPIILLPMGPFDVPALEEIHARLPRSTRIVIPEDWLEDAPAIAQDARFMISVPHHPLIFALQTGTPIVSVVEGAYYVDKNVGSMRFFGLSSFVVDAARDDAPERLRRLVDTVVDHEAALRSYIAGRIGDLSPVLESGTSAFREFLSGTRSAVPLDALKQADPLRSQNLG